MSASITAINDNDVPTTSMMLQATGLWRRLWSGASTPQPAYLVAARAGEPDALAQLYTDYQPAVWRLCRRLLRREADAEDAMQSTFVKAFAALPRFRGDANLKTWLYKIAVNEATNLLRKRESVADTDDTATIEMVIEPLGMSDAERIAVRALLGTLKPDHRTILTLRYWEELSYEEIADVLSLPLPSVKMRLHRAKEAFRTQYVGANDSERGSN